MFTCCPFVYLSLYICLSKCLLISLMSVCLFACSLNHLFFSIFLIAYSSRYLSVSLFVRQSIFQSICLYNVSLNYLSIFLLICSLRCCQIDLVFFFSGDASYILHHLIFCFVSELRILSNATCFSNH